MTVVWTSGLQCAAWHTTANVTAALHVILDRLFTGDQRSQLNAARHLITFSQHSVSTPHCSLECARNKAVSWPAASEAI